MANLPMTSMHLYTCSSCIIAFGVEAHEDIDHSMVVCPICQTDLALEDAGSGKFILISLPEEVASDA